MNVIKVFESSRGDLFSFTVDEQNPEPTPVKDFFNRRIKPGSTVVYWTDQDGAVRYWDKANPGLWCIVYPVNHPNVPTASEPAALDIETAKGV